MDAMLSPEQAARRVGVSRRTILRAVQRQELKAVRDNRNRWRIEAEALDTWAAPRASTGQPTVPAQRAHGAAHSEAEILAALRERDELRLQLTGRQAELEGIREVLRVVEADRDAWRDLVRQPWWQRLFGTRQLR